LVDETEKPVIVECKQHSPSIENIEQLRGYMNKIQQETGKNPRGILVHGGSQKLNPAVHDFARSYEDIEIINFRVNIDFRRSG
jgi:RecB family endonuclease NucS